ncbi:MAG: hypothetical protein GX663_02915 [Clostridiales bacterium]|nr:hypothetical protein [Clostridiales bacterium]
MRKKSKWMIVVMALIMAFSLTACGDSEEPAESADCWADQYAALIESGEAREFADYDSMKATLDDIRDESGATYVYAMSPMKDGKPSLDGDATAEGSFAITVDGSEDPDDWGVDYGWEIQFTEAWEGTPAAARSAWNDSDTEQCWSAFAPVYDEEGNVICLLGIDFPCTDVIVDNPQWNRDGDSWNGFEDEITGEVPETIQAMMDDVTALADKYAKQLSHSK